MVNIIFAKGHLSVQLQGGIRDTAERSSVIRVGENKQAKSWNSMCYTSTLEYIEDHKQKCFKQIIKSC